jgi:chemotaxis protein MotB
MNEGTPIIIKKKKGHGDHAHHGGSWKVAYADFVTAMMAFFMVMWIMGLSDDTRTQVSGYFNDPYGFMKRPPRTRTVMAMQLAPPSFLHVDDKLRHQDLKKQVEQANFAKIAKGIAKNLKDLVDGQSGLNPATLANVSKNVEVTINPEGLKIEFLETAGSVFFESGSKVIRPEARPIIKSVGYVLAKSGRLMSIKGHTDAHPYPSQDYNNNDLSSERALSVLHVFELCGVGEQQIRSVEGLASTEPKIPSDPFNPANRRVSVLLPFDNKIIGPEEGEKLDRKSSFTEGFSIAPTPITNREKANAENWADHADEALSSKSSKNP